MVYVKEQLGHGSIQIERGSVSSEPRLYSRLRWDEVERNCFAESAARAAASERRREVAEGDRECAARWGMLKGPHRAKLENEPPRNRTENPQIVRTNGDCPPVSRRCFHVAAAGGSLVVRPPVSTGDRPLVCQLVCQVIERSDAPNASRTAISLVRRATPSAVRP